MLLTMKIFISDQQKVELERLHDSSRDGLLKNQALSMITGIAIQSNLFHYFL